MGDTARLVESLIGSDASVDIATAVWDRTAGNPLFIGELLKLVSSTGQLEDLLERRKTASPSTAALRSTVIQRLDRLSPACVQMMTRSSVLGRTFQLGLAEGLVDLSENQLLDAVDEGLQAGLLLETGNDDDLSFLHGIVHEVLYAELSTEDRASLHRAAGRLLATRAGNRDGEVLPQLARHFYLGVDEQTWGPAVAYCERAGEQARQQLSYHEAAEQLTRAIDVSATMLSGTVNCFSSWERLGIWRQIHELLLLRSGKPLNSLVNRMMPSYLGVPPLAMRRRRCTSVSAISDR